MFRNIFIILSTHLIHKSRQPEQIPVSQWIPGKECVFVKYFYIYTSIIVFCHALPDSKVECSLLELLHLEPVHPAATVPQVQYGNIVPENGEEVHFYPETYCHLLKLGRGGNHLFLES